METRIIGTRVTLQTFDIAIARMLEAVRTEVPLRAHFATVHSLVEARSNAALSQAFASAAMVCTDGVPLVWVGRLRGLRGERVCGPDTLLALCDRGRADGLRHFFLGGAPGTPERLAANLGARFPGLQVAGTESPPFGPLTVDEDDALVARVNGSAAQVVWVGLGSPKQEIWAAEHAPRLRAPVLLPVGAAFDFYGDRTRRAPRWMQRLGLEWLFRLASEPRRLARRYAVTNAKFVWLLTTEVIRSHRRTGPDDEK